MKKFIVIVLLLLLSASYVTQTKAYEKAYPYIYYSTCQKPIKYKIGSIDPKFNLSEKQVIADAAQAAGIWKKSYGKELLVYDPAGELTINLTYDERQTLVNKINMLNNQLDKGKSTLDPEIAAHQKKAADFEKRLQDFRSQVDYWNSRGGAPEDEYNKLKKQEAALKAEADALNEEARQLHQQTVSFNSQVDKLNSTVNTFNSTLTEKPEEGIYDPQTNRIDIYFNIDQTELVHTLAHEMGHALGLEHVNVANSIMYPTTSKSLAPSKEEVLQLREICRERGVWEIAQTRLDTVIQFYKQRLSTLSAKY